MAIRNELFKATTFCRVSFEALLAEWKASFLLGAASLLAFGVLKGAVAPRHRTPDSL